MHDVKITGVMKLAPIVHLVLTVTFNEVNPGEIYFTLFVY